jgi:Ca2+-binding RTX toxin-like protein
MTAGAVFTAALALAPAALAASTATVSGTLLTVTGSASPDQITVWLGGGDGIGAGHDGVIAPPTVDNPYVVDDPAGVSPGGGCSNTDPATAVVNPNRAWCTRNATPFGNFEVRANGAEGADWIQAIRPLQAVFDLVHISGGIDGDALFGSQTSDYISGDAGNDLIDGGAGADFLSGGTISALLPSPEGAVTQPASYTPGPGAGVDRVYGGNFDDQITDGDNDTDPAQLDSDKVDGGVCLGGAAEDIALPAGVPAPAGVTTCPQLANNVDGPEDHDALMVAHRTKPLVVDLLVADASQGGPGENERIRRIEAVWGGTGDDRFYGRDGDLGDESLRGNGGNDHLEARGGDDELIGGDGQDTLLGGAGADIINPGGHIITPPGAPTEMVSDGPDYIDGATNSTIVGGHSQTDLVTYDGRTDVLRLDMGAGNTLGAPGENDTLVGIEDIMGGHRGDTIIGDAGPNLIAGDPLPPLFNIPPDPPAYPAAPGGHAGDDNIDTRDASRDIVDCTEGTADVHLSDALDASINCENIPPLPQCSDKKDNDNDGKIDHPADPGCESPTDDTESGDTVVTDRRVKISGKASAGSIRVGKTGSFTLKKHVITCPAPKGASACKITNAVAATTGKKAKLGGRSYTLKAGTKGAANAKLTKKHLAQLKKRKSLKSVLTIKGVVGGKTTIKKVKVTLKAPKKPRKKR